MSEEVYLYIYIVETFYTLSSISNKAVDKKGNRAETRAVSFFAFSSPRLMTFANNTVDAASEQKACFLGACLSMCGWSTRANPC